MNFLNIFRKRDKRSLLEEFYKRYPVPTEDRTVKIKTVAIPLNWPEPKFFESTELTENLHVREYREVRVSYINEKDFERWVEKQWERIENERDNNQTNNNRI